MDTTKAPVLAPPAPFFGAVKGERKLSRRWYGWTAFAALLVILAAFSKPLYEVFLIPISEDNSGMYPTMWVFVVLWLFGWFAYTDDVLSAHEKKFSADIRRLKQEYFTKEVIPYIAQKYDAEIPSDAAYHLYEGYPCRLRVQGVIKKVRLSGKIGIGQYAMEEVPRFYPEDLIFEEVIDPAVTQYVPLKPVI